MADDGNLRPIFRDHLRHFHWSTIETGWTQMGIPDAEFAYQGAQGWIEFKQTEGSACTLKPEQVGWHVRRHMEGGRSFIAVRRWHDGGPRKGPPVDELWLYEGRHARELKTHGLLESIMLGRWGGGPTGWPWGVIQGILIGDVRILRS